MLFEVPYSVPTRSTDLAVVRSIFAGNNLQEGGFTTSITTEKSHSLTGIDRQRGARKELALTKMLL